MMLGSFNDPTPSISDGRRTVMSLNKKMPEMAGTKKKGPRTVNSKPQMGFLSRVDESTEMLSGLLIPSTNSKRSL